VQQPVQRVAGVAAQEAPGFLVIDIDRHIAPVPECWRRVLFELVNIVGGDGKSRSVSSKIDVEVIDMEGSELELCAKMDGRELYQCAKATEIEDSWELAETIAYSLVDNPEIFAGTNIYSKLGVVIPISFCWKKA